MPTDDRLGTWMPIVNRDPPQEPDGGHSSGAVDEEFHNWGEHGRLAFRALNIRRRVATAWAEPG